MAFTLGPDAAAAGYRCLAFDTIGSTNREAMERARDGEAGPLWVVSSHQSEGRGRRGSPWQTEPGNLAASLLLTLDLPPATIATLGFVAGVAAVQALERCAAPFEAGPGPRSSFETRGAFTLKWPNDVLLDGAKLAGILLETEQTGQGRAVVVGIGVNVAHAPAGLPYAAASLRGAGIQITAEDLFASLSAEWVRAVALWDDGRGFPHIREAWLRRAAGLRGEVTVQAAASVIRGTFETIDGTGQLVLRGRDGAAHHVAAGDVHFGEAATLRPEVAA